MSLSHSSSIVTSGLILNLDAANIKSYPGTGTTWTNLMSSSYNGTLTGGPTYSSSNKGTIVFDGTDDYIVLPSVGALNTFTIDVWVYATSLPANFASFITDIYPSFVNFKIGYHGSSGVVTAGIFSGTSWTYSSTSTLVANTWTNFVMTYDGANIVLYKNNVSTTPVEYTGTRNTTGTGIRIGRRWDNADYFVGNIPTAKIYNKSLTSLELTQNFNALRGRYGI